MFFKVCRGRKIDKKNYLKISLTLVVLMIATIFHWIDKLYFKFRLSGFRFVKPPLFILGHWRSGTTLLHNLLAHDPDSGYVTTYQAVFPNNLRSHWLFGTFMKIFMPAERPGDQLKLDTNFPQEDEYALSNMTHMSYYHSFYFPRHYLSYYNDYVRFRNIPEKQLIQWKYLYRRMVSIAMLNTKGQRAILKNPANTGRIDKLLEIWPDAQFVFIIRNPIIVYLSSKKFFSQLYPTLELEHITKSEIKHMVLDIYTELMTDYLELKKRIPQENLLEIRYEDLKKSPLQVLELIHKKFGFEDFNTVSPAYEGYLNSQKKHKMHRYKIEKNELEQVALRLGFAMKYWGYSIPDSLDVYDKTAFTKDSKMKNYTK